MAGLGRRVTHTLYMLSGPLGLGDLCQENCSSCEVFMDTTRPPTLPGEAHSVVTRRPQLGPSPAAEVKGLKLNHTREASTPLCKWVGEKGGFSLRERGFPSVGRGLPSLQACTEM